MSNASVKFEGTGFATNERLAYFRSELSLDRYEKMIDYISNATVEKKNGRILIWQQCRQTFMFVHFAARPSRKCIARFQGLFLFDFDFHSRLCSPQERCTGAPPLTTTKTCFYQAFLFSPPSIYFSNYLTSSCCCHILLHCFLIQITSRWSPYEQNLATLSWDAKTKKRLC